MFLIEKPDLEAYALGAAFLGTGGGGDTYLPRLMLDKVLENGQEIAVKKLHEFDDEQFVVGAGYFGAPAIMTEKLPSGYEAVAAIKAMQDVIGKTIDAIMVIEIGGANSLMPMFVAAELGLPVIDGDGMGRAFPKMQMQTYSIYSEFPEYIATVCNEHGEVITLRRRNAEKMEECLRDLAVTMGGMISVCTLPMTVAQLKTSMIVDTVETCLAVGNELVKLKKPGADIENFFRFFADTLYGKAKCVFQGKVVDMHLENTKGFSMGNAVVQSFNGNAVADVTFQNENLIVKINSQVIATVPDLITIVDMDTATPVTCEGIRYGQRVNIIVIRAPEMLRHKEALATVGPAAFGLAYPYQPLG